MRVKYLASVLVSTVVLTFAHHSNAQEKIEVSESCLLDFLVIQRAAAYNHGFNTVWDRAYDMKERMEAEIYDVETEDMYNGAIQITNDIIDLYDGDEIMQDMDRLFGRIGGKYDLPEGREVSHLRQRVFDSDC